MCPVGGCGGSATTRSSMRRHFMNRHPQDSLTIVEEGPIPLPKCKLCGVHVPSNALNSGHKQKGFCKTGADRRRQRQAIQCSQQASKVIFTIGGSSLETVSTFKYLGRPISSTDDDWPAIHLNLSKAREQWAMVSKVLRREDATPKISAMFYKAVVQSVLLYGAETWVMTPAVLLKLESFHKRIARRLANKMPYYVALEDKWIYPDIEVALETAGMYMMEHYVQVRQKTLMEVIGSRPIMEYCQQIARKSGSSRKSVWWGRLI